MSGIVSPQDATGVEAKTGAFNRVWVGFFAGLARKLNGLSKLGQVSAPAAAAAPGAYSQAHIDSLVTLANELRTKMNSIDTAANG